MKSEKRNYCFLIEMRKLEFLVNLAILLGPIVIGITILALLKPLTTILASLVCFSVGIAMLVQAKTSLFMRGVWISFGPSQMDGRARRAYWLAYGFIALGAGMNVLAQLTLTGGR